MKVNVFCVGITKKIKILKFFVVNVVFLKKKQRVKVFDPVKCLRRKT